MNLTDKESFLPLLVENKFFIKKLKKRHHSTQPLERKQDQSCDSFYEKSFVVQKKELQFRTLEPKKQYIVKRPKLQTSKEIIADEIPFDKVIIAFFQNTNNGKENTDSNNSKIKYKKALKIITQHRELETLEEEHKSLKGKFFTEIQSYLSECKRL